MEGDFSRFMDCLMKAGAKIAQQYFLIPIAGSKQSILRERVYCYELYHQLRNALGDCFPYALYGEFDKEKHPIIHPKIGSKKPDFILNVPGNMDRNLVVIEVKPLTVRAQDLRKDLWTLRQFLDNANYFRAIMLVYGVALNNFPSSSKRIGRIVFEVESQNQNSRNPLLLMWHSCHGEKPKILSGAACG